MSEELKTMKQTLMAAAQSQMGNLDKVNAEELGEVMDMIKDLAEAEYYCSIVKAMEENKKDREDSEKIMMATSRNQQYYTPYMRYLDPRYNDMPGYPGGNSNYDNTNRRMYYDGNGGSSNGGSSSSGGNGGGNSASMNGNNARGYYDYVPPYFPPEMRDYREGRSPMSRRGYMEAKEMHQDSSTSLNKLEKYINELSGDIVEMTNNASPDEKNLLHQKLAALANKIQ